MRLVVVDTSVLAAALMRDGITREILLSAKGIEFFAPPMLQVEAQQNLGELLPRLGLDMGAGQALLASVIARISIVQPPAYASFRPMAQEMAKKAEAWDDDEYVALALAMDIPIWTYDHDFGRIKGVHTVTTAELARG